MSGNDGRADDALEPNASRRAVLKATGAATAATALGAGRTAAEERSENAGEGDPDVDRILDDLTLRQKVGQMVQVDVSTFDPESTDVPDGHDAETLGEYFTEVGVGSILCGGAAPPSHDPGTVVSGINDLQSYNLSETDHGIPFLWGIDAVHGNATLAGATVLPQRINMGATRDPDLVERAEAHTAESVTAMGAHWNFAPTTDVLRDPRWGRFYEGVSEDPLLQGDVSRARVRGLQTSDRLCATVKHFAGYSIPENGNDRAHARTSMRDLRTSILPPYREALAEDPKAVMVNSGAVNGKPVHASSWLLTGVLRNQYGFDGVVLSDYNDFQRMIGNHDYVPDYRSAVRAGIEVGVDVAMIGRFGESPGPTAFVETAVSLVEDGELSEERIDRSVRRILELKADLGVFEEPTVDESRIESVVGGGADASRELATESLVLLENDGALPLSGDEDVLLTGPGTNPDPDGDLSWMARDTGFLIQHGGWTLGFQGVQGGSPTPDGPRPRQTTLADGLDAALDGSLTHEPTGFAAAPFSDDSSDPNGDFSFDNESAVRSAAADADAVVVVLGEGPHSEGFGDRDELALDRAQRDLVAAVTDAAPETPVIGVVFAGSPRGTAETFSQLDAVLFAGEPGSDAGTAVADVLVGDANPSGKLPFQWPAGVGRVPNNYDAYPPLDEHEPLYPFGHGLSYTDFEYGDVSVAPSSVDDPGEAETVTVSVEVRNAGDRDGDHVVEVYCTESYGSVLQPDRRLLGYERVSLAAGESRTVEVAADLAALEVVPGDVPAIQPRTVEAGESTLAVGDVTTTLTVESDGSVSGDGVLPNPADLVDGDVDGGDLAELLEVLRGFVGGDDCGRGLGLGRPDR